MKRKEFLTKSIAGLGGAVAFSALLHPQRAEEEHRVRLVDDCEDSARETRGPFPNKNPSALVTRNIVGDRKGVALLIELIILDKAGNCRPLEGALVDIWHCDNQGHYSEYGGTRMQNENHESRHFLRGRQHTDAMGKVSFQSIFPGYYRGRAPHLHIEVKGKDEKSLLVTQIAFPENVCDMVYASEGYQGKGYVSNASDGVFRDSLERNMADVLTGDAGSGFRLDKTLVV
jgi:protocatechuate 3,4-dioxygenase beta subunit